MLQRWGPDDGLSFAHQGNHAGLPLLCRAGFACKVNFAANICFRPHDSFCCQLMIKPADDSLGTTSLLTL